MPKDACRVRFSDDHPPSGSPKLPAPRALRRLADALEDNKSIPWSYVAKAAVYMITCISAALAAGVWLFEDRELS